MEAAVLTNDSAPRALERDDVELLAAYRDGSETAFAELVRRHQIPVFRLLLGITGDADEAELLCEQVFFEAARRLPDSLGAQTFAAWLLGLSRELCKKAEEKRPKGTVMRRPLVRPRDPKARVKQEVKTALSELSGDERVALILADLEGDSFENIAHTLGTSVEQAEEIVHTARTKFERGLVESDETAAEAPPKEKLLQPGALLGGRFRVESLLGKGGMGAVYRAIDTQTGAAVAVKTLLPAGQADAMSRRRFAREAEIIQRLQHPNFVRLIEYGQQTDEPSYVAMELLDGQALNLLLARESKLEPRRALSIVRHLLHGLCYAHAEGVIHRDLKPENVMLVAAEGDPDFAKLLDLGIAKLVGPEDARRTRLTQQGELMGTPLYISPEMLRGDALDARADLYSLTVVLYEMLAARPPFQAGTSTALFAMHLVTPPPALGDLAPDVPVPAELDRLLQHGLAKDPNLRVASAESYLGRVEELLRLDWDKLPRGTRAAATAQGRAATRPKARAVVAAPIEAAATPSGLRRFAAFVVRSRSTLITVVLSVLALIGLVYWVTHDILR